MQVKTHSVRGMLSMLNTLLAMPVSAFLYFVIAWIERVRPQDDDKENGCLWEYMLADAKKLLQPKEPAWFAEQDKLRQSGPNTAQRMRWAKLYGYGFYTSLDPSQQDILEQVVKLMHTQKLDAVKLVKNEIGTSLMDAKKLVEELMEM